ncbi:MAG: hypothetical protein HRT88_14985 [Lentisphaeraceae bacterium]|nr:hypothetical protein [Lentisphaeraceae bacterium]
MTSLEQMPHPTHCYCQFSKDIIHKWVVERYVKNIPTVQLLNSVNTAEEKEAIAAVALIDVDDDTLLQMMGNVDLPQQHILNCREHAKREVQRIKAEA